MISTRDCLAAPADQGSADPADREDRAWDLVTVRTDPAEAAGRVGAAAADADDGGN